MADRQGASVRVPKAGPRDGRGGMCQEVGNGDADDEKKRDANAFDGRPP